MRVGVYQNNESRLYGIMTYTVASRGLVAALGAMRLLQWRLYQVAPNDAPALAGVAAGMIVLAIGAALVPARRALAVDPVTSLKAD